MSDDQQTPDAFGKTPAQYAANRAMNAMFVKARDAVAPRPIGEISGSAVQPPEVAERLSRAVTDAEAAHKSGRQSDIDTAEQALTEALDAARSSREAAEQDRLHPRNEDGTFASFDGGVRGTPVHMRSRRSSGWPSSSDLIKEAIVASRQESIERERERPISELFGNR